MQLPSEGEVISQRLGWDGRRSKTTRMQRWWRENKIAIEEVGAAGHNDRHFDPTVVLVQGFRQFPALAFTATLGSRSDATLELLNTE